MIVGNDMGEIKTKKILLMTDHHMSASVVNGLEAEGYYVYNRACQDFEIELLETLEPTAVMIDLDYPSIEGISICQTLRTCYDGPILVLTAKTDEIVQIMGLEMGADDFLLKPQSKNYLLVKLRACLRRSEKYRVQEKKTVQLGELIVDSARREVLCSGAIIPLTTREFDLLWCLAEKAKNIVSREEIHQALYNSEYNGFDRSIDIYVSRIRQKIGDDSLHPRYLKTIRGAGYLLVEGYSE
ncbi:two component transcriptional regulator, winged helix family [Desulfuromusa kysingii]|uniref:Two component transcriptional regulator, winged helix family n=1 Tax=Desulfuromusa kysingii TaxID=37625 RepID=A0A1H3VYS5_9BACT|nr:response regulator transcription factor [Desulfuromusa kysingii]SDZ79900.1 two component transcriptional regulator, winged helix family [Desulfuromusa kysingii]